MLVFGARIASLIFGLNGTFMKNSEPGIIIASYCSADARKLHEQLAWLIWQ